MRRRAAGTRSRQWRSVRVRGVTKLVLASTAAIAAVGISGCGGNEAEEPSQQDEDVAPEWSYSGKTGPERWGELSPAYAECSEGRRQSPIDLAAATPGGVPTLELGYAPARAVQVNNGHVIQFDEPNDGGILLDGRRYDLMQFHYHAPAEHVIGDERAPMELHIVHADANRNLAVLGVFLEEGASNPVYERLFGTVATKKGEQIPLDAPFDPQQLLPESRSFYSYSGSLTTPPCSEGVRWIVFRQPVELSADQIARFTDVYSGNARPVQALNGRRVATTP